MAGGEFDLIRRWFAQLGATLNDVAIGVGDDAALLRLPLLQPLASPFPQLLLRLRLLLQPLVSPFPLLLLRLRRAAGSE